MDKKISVSTRFHSWAENDFSLPLDLNELIIKHPAATFFVRVRGEMMFDSGINTGDILVVDRALSLSHHKMVIARLDGQLVVRRVLLAKGNLLLVRDNHTECITAERDFELWGVVTYVIRQT